MRNTHSMNEVPCRKQISFDLSEEKLDKYFPRPARKVASRYYARAWDDISFFMTANGFEHIEYSVYASNMEMKSIEVAALIRRMVKCMPWLGDCLKEFHVTDIGLQHDMLDYIRDLALEFREKPS